MRCLGASGKSQPPSHFPTELASGHLISSGGLEGFLLWKASSPPSWVHYDLWLSQNGSFWDRPQETIALQWRAWVQSGVWQEEAGSPWQPYSRKEVNAH